MPESPTVLTSKIIGRRASASVFVQAHCLITAHCPHTAVAEKYYGSGRWRVLNKLGNSTETIIDNLNNLN